MATVGEFYDLIDAFAPFHTAMGFDNPGLLVGDRGTEVHSALFAHVSYTHLDIRSNCIGNPALPHQPDGQVSMVGSNIHQLCSLSNHRCTQRKPVPQGKQRMWHTTASFSPNMEPPPAKHVDGRRVNRSELICPAYGR